LNSYKHDHLILSFLAGPLHVVSCLITNVFENPSTFYPPLHVVTTSTYSTPVLSQPTKEGPFSLEENFIKKKKKERKRYGILLR